MSCQFPIYKALEVSKLNTYLVLLLTPFVHKNHHTSKFIEMYIIYNVYLKLLHIIVLFTQ